MTEERFDLSYSGDLLAGADPAVVRERLRTIFHLSDESSARLFTGHPVSIKRNADAATATRFREVFTQAGALLRVSRVETPEEASDLAATHLDGERPPVQGDVREPDEAGATALSLAAQDGFLEAPATTNIDAFDTSALSLVAGQSWSLADCEPPPTPIPIPDISHLSLAETEPPSKTKKPAE